MSNDWKRIDIIYALNKQGTNLSRLSRKSGLNSRTLNNVFYRRYPKGERIIANEIGVPPQVIWPSRYAVGEI